MFSKACEYAIKTMIYVATNEKKGRRTGLKEVTNAIDSPEAFTAKILQQLAKGGLLESHRGPGGGFLLAERKILLHDVVKTIDGDSLMNACVLGLKECSGSNPCPVHEDFLPIRNQISEVLLATDIRDEKLLSGNHILKI
ncbi:MAG: Rrf2 family transcriptional regulator [Cyclobacteriaceae bacterium]